MQGSVKPGVGAVLHHYGEDAGLIHRDGHPGGQDGGGEPKRSPRWCPSFHLP